jgi:hypothetical protein
MDEDYIRNLTVGRVNFDKFEDQEEICSFNGDAIR